MSVELEDLTEGEKYLWAILSDPSGLDLAEFSWYFPAEDQMRETDECWRAYPFQYRWFRCTDRLQLDQCGRSIGKTLSIILRAFAFPFLHPNQDMLLTAPEKNHLDAVTELIEYRIYETRLSRELLQTDRGGVTHRPFKMIFRNGARVIGRIPQPTGKGVKGQHPLWLEQDEAQDYPDKGWIELAPTLKPGSMGAVWRAHGVSRGVRDFFYKFSTDQSAGWTVHRLTALHRPTWTAEERSQYEHIYGGRHSPDWRRNVLGLHGDSTNVLFVLSRLMACVDDDQASHYNLEEYYKVRINDTEVEDAGGKILSLVNLPELHRANYKVFWVGMDLGWTDDPSEILVFGEYVMTPDELKEARKVQKDEEGQVLPRKAVPKNGLSRLKLITRITMERINSADQMEVIAHVIDFYKPKAFSMDATGAGLPIFQILQREHPESIKVIKGYNFKEKILVDWDRRSPLEATASKDDKESAISIQVLEYSTDELRRVVDTQRFWLPWDTELIGEFQGQTYVVVASKTDRYGRKRMSKGADHTLDAARMAILGWKQYAIEEIVAKKQIREDVIDMVPNFY